MVSWLKTAGGVLVVFSLGAVLSCGTVPEKGIPSDGSPQPGGTEELNGDRGKAAESASQDGKPSVPEDPDLSGISQKERGENSPQQPPPKTPSQPYQIIEEQLVLDEEPDSESYPLPEPSLPEPEESSKATQAQHSSVPESKSLPPSASQKNPKQPGGTNKPAEKTAQNSDNKAINPATENSTGDDVSVWKRREIFARPGADIDIFLPGSGWIYLPPEEVNGIVRFQSKNLSGEGTTFTFMPLTLGKSVLHFQRQDLSQGRNYYQEIVVKVLNDQEFNSAVGSLGEDGVSAGDYSLAEDYWQEGKLEKALSAYLKAYQEGDGQINQRIAELSFSLGDYQRAREFWQKNLDQQDKELQGFATIGVVECGLKLDDQQLIRANLGKFLMIEDLPVKDIWKELTQYEYAQENYPQAITLLEGYAQRFSTDSWLDYVYYSLGEIYEKKGAFRDLKKSRHYYSLVVENFPISQYWEAAKKRILYIDRHYFQIK